MAERRKFAGVGFVLTEDDGYTGVDLDKCRDPATGKLDQWAEDIVALNETYWELSPSGTGLRAFVRGKIEKTVKCDTARVEVYRSLRYLTYTGEHIEGTPEDIRPAPLTLEWLMDRVAQFAPKAAVDLTPIKLEQSPAAPTKLYQDNDTGPRKWAEAALAGVAADLAACGEGGRNHALNKAAFRMGTMVARNWIERSRVEHALTDACLANGLFASDGPGGVRATLASGLTSGIQNPHEDLRDDRADDAELKARGDQAAAVLIAKYGTRQDNGPRKTIVVDGVTIDAETGEIVEEPPCQDEAPRTENEAPRPPAGSKPIELETINAASFARKPVPRQHWLVEDLIPEGNVTLLSGDGATGKSLLALQLAVAVATGGPWIGLKPESGRALYVSAEDEIDELHRRLARIVPKLETLGQLTLVPLAGKDAVLSAPSGRDGLLKPTPIYTALRHIVAKHRPDLLVLDTLADLFGGDEIKKVHARQFISMLRGLAIEFDVTVLLLSHPSQSGMASGDGTSGNTAWNNSVRSRLYFERRIFKEGLKSIEDDADIRVLTTKKANRAAAGGKIVVRWRDGGFVRENQACDSGDISHDANRVFMTLLAQFEREERFVSDRPSASYAPTVFAKHPKAQGMNKGVLQKAMDRLFEAGKIKVEEVGPPSRRVRKIAVVDSPEGEGEASDCDYEGDSDDGL